MMFKKKSALNVRPEPPSFAEITEDINSADSNDIIFAKSTDGMLVRIIVRPTVLHRECY